MTLKKLEVGAAPRALLKPLKDDEIKNTRKDFCKLVVLYKDNKDNIQVGVPDLERYKPDEANMYGIGASKEVAFFKNIKRDPNELSQTTDRPVFDIAVDRKRQVLDYRVVNNYEDIDLDDVFDGNFIVEENNIKTK